MVEELRKHPVEGSQTLQRDSCVDIMLLESERMLKISLVIGGLYRLISNEFSRLEFRRKITSDVNVARDRKVCNVYASSTF